MPYSTYHNQTVESVVIMQVYEWKLPPEVASLRNKRLFYDEGIKKYHPEDDIYSQVVFNYRIGSVKRVFRLTFQKVSGI